MGNSSWLGPPLSSLLLNMKSEDVGQGPALTTKQSWSYLMILCLTVECPFLRSGIILWQKSYSPGPILSSYALQLSVLSFAQVLSYGKSPTSTLILLYESWCPTPNESYSATWPSLPHLHPRSPYSICPNPL
jgi:hypothetical protein